MPSRSQLRVMWAAHKFLWRISGGRLGRRAGGMDVLELVTTGHASGQSRSVLLFYLDGENGPLVVGSNSGADYEPAWIKNLRADRTAEVILDGESSEVEAHFLEGEEREKAFQRFEANYSDYSVYERATNRVIPVVELVRRNA